jgi:hypothetical protein
LVRSWESKMEIPGKTVGIRIDKNRSHIWVQSRRIPHETRFARISCSAALAGVNYVRLSSRKAACSSVTPSSSTGNPGRAGLARGRLCIRGSMRPVLLSNASHHSSRMARIRTSCLSLSRDEREVRAGNAGGFEERRRNELVTKVPLQVAMV